MKEDNYKSSKMLRSDEMEYFEALYYKVSDDLSERNMLSQKILECRVAMTEIDIEMKIHASKKGKNEQWEKRNELNSKIMGALTEASRLDTKVYELECFVKSLLGQRNLYYKNWKESEKQLQAVELAWESQ